MVELRWVWHNPKDGPPKAGYIPVGAPPQLVYMILQQKVETRDDYNNIKYQWKDVLLGA